ncbi:MAG: hypothetical protein EHM13_11325, partial [Acidobacteria bacterium]
MPIKTTSVAAALLLGLCMAVAVPAFGQSAATPGTPAAAVPPVKSQVAVGTLPSRPIPGLVFAEVHMSELPLSGSLWSLMETADPFVTVDRMSNGGLYVGEPEMFGSHGSSGTQAGFLMDGLDLTDPERTGTPLLLAGADVFQSVGVAYSFPAPEVGGAGPTLVLVPRAPAAAWAGELAVSYVPNQFQARNDRAGAPSIARFGSAGSGEILLGGPVSGQVGLFVTGIGTVVRRFERGDPVAVDSRLASFFAHPSIQVSPSSRLRLIASVDGAIRPYPARALFPDRNARGRDDYRHLHATWEHVSGGGSTWSASAGYQAADIATPDADAGALSGVIERLL